MSLNYDKIIDGYRNWMTTNSGGICDPEVRTYSEILRFTQSLPSERDCRGVGLRLGYCSNWFNRQGVLEVADGLERGWSLLAQASDYQFWDHRICCRAYDFAENKRKASNFVPNAFRVGMCALHCLALGDAQHGKWLGVRLQRSKGDGSVRSWPQAHPTTHLAIFLVNLLSNNSATDAEIDDLGIFAAVRESWNDLDALRSALIQAADFHVERMEKPTSEDENDFGAPLYDICPVEILAIYRVRRELGLLTPRIDHPLIETPFGNLPDVITPVQDELLIRVIGKVREVMPYL